MFYLGLVIPFYCLLSEIWKICWKFTCDLLRGLFISHVEVI